MKRFESDFEFTDAEVAEALFDYVQKHHPHEYPPNPEKFRLSYYTGCNVWLHWTEAGMKETKSKDGVENDWTDWDLGTRSLIEMCRRKERIEEQILPTLDITDIKLHDDGTATVILKETTNAEMEKSK